MRYLFLGIILILFTCGCFENDIQITSEYVINRNWSKGKNGEDANSIGIMKMRIKTGHNLDPYAQLNQQELLDNLEYDSSFSYTAVIKTKPDESYQNKKIYFNRDNGFYWWTDNGNKKVKYIGNLLENTWYEVNDLTRYSYIIYVDNTKKIHLFSVDLATNF